MKCRKQLRYHKIPISSLWEVHLDVHVWTRVVKAAKNRGCTISWITRYCVFRLARKKNLYMRQAMKIHSNELKSKYTNLQCYHRHIICLYGDDEKLLRIAAMQLGITVSHMIRMALYWFLPKVENFSIKWQEIYYHGTKICRFLSFVRKSMLKIPFFDTIFYEKWCPSQWWRRPRFSISVPFTPVLNNLSIDNMKNLLPNNIHVKDQI